MESQRKGEEWTGKQRRRGELEMRWEREKNRKNEGGEGRAWRRKQSEREG